MTNNINNINGHSSISNMIQTAELNKIEAYFNHNKNSKFLVLSLDDLNMDTLNQLKAKQCRMLLLNENFKIVDQSQAKKVQHIRILIEGVKQVVAIENIIRFEAFGNYTYVHLQNCSKPVLTSKTLKYYADLLDVCFIRPHSKHLINLKYIASINKENTLDLTDNTTVQISRRRLSYIKQVLNSF